MPGPKRTPTSVSIPTAAIESTRVPREISFDEPTGVTEDPMEAIRSVDRKVRQLGRNQEVAAEAHRSFVETDRADHQEIRDGQVRLESRFDKLDDKVDEKFDAVAARLDTLATSHIQVSTARQTADIQVTASKREAEIKLDADSKITKRVIVRDGVSKLLTPLLTAAGTLFAAYVAGILHVHC